MLLQYALYAPDIRRNLLSLVIMLRFGFKFVFENNCIFND